MRTVLTYTTCALVLAAGAAAAQEKFPSRPLRIVVGFGAGSATDILSREVAVKMADRWNQGVVVDNRPGAGAVIASEMLARASADGHTLAMVSLGHAFNPSYLAKLPYDTLKDFAAVTMIASSPNLLVVNPSLPASTIAEFLAYARANPGKVNVASAGNGSLSHLSVEMLKSLGRIDIVNVGYKGAAPALNDLVAGQVAAMIINIPSTLPLVKAGKLRALAATSAGRTQLMPELPTLAEAGLTGYETLAWFGLVAPAKTPPEVIARLQSETAKVLVRPDVRAQLTNLGAEPSGNSSEAFAAFMQSEVSKYSRVIREAGIKVE